MIEEEQDLDCVSGNVVDQDISDEENDIDSEQVVLVESEESPSRTSGRSHSNRIHSNNNSSNSGGGGGSSHHSMNHHHLTSTNSPNVRKGKWTSEEENYTQKIISLFNRGKLPIPAGTTLRSYLSEKLNCDPMRITKKFAGATSIGKVVYQPSEMFTESSSSYSSSSRRHEDPVEMEELRRLELLFLEKLHGKDREAVRSTSSRQSSKDSRDSRDVTSPATAKIAEVVEKIRAHDRGLRSSGGRLIHMKKEENNYSKSGLGIKRIVSAPNFSQLSTLLTPWRHKDDQVNNANDTNNLSNLNDSNNLASFAEGNSSNSNSSNSRYNQHNNRLRHNGLYLSVTSNLGPKVYEKRRFPLVAAGIAELQQPTAIHNSIHNSTLHHPSLSGTSIGIGFRSKKRSQSVIDFQEYENLTSIMENDQAAGDLLLQFSENVRRTSFATPLTDEMNTDKDNHSNNGIDTNHYGEEETLNVTQEESYQLFSPKTYNTSTSTHASPDADVGLSLDDDQQNTNINTNITSMWNHLPPTIPLNYQLGDAILSSLPSLPSSSSHDSLLILSTTNMTLNDKNVMPSNYSKDNNSSGNNDDSPIHQMKRSRSNDLIASITLDLGLSDIDHNQNSSDNTNHNMIIPSPNTSTLSH